MDNELYDVHCYEDEFVVPDGIESLVRCFNSDPVEEISLPSSLVSIDTSFFQCRELRKIVFRDGANPDLKINKDSFGLLFSYKTAEQILEFDAPDIIRIHIFKEHFRESQTLHMKRAVLLAYLNGKPASGKFEEAIIRYAKKDFENLLLYFCAAGDAELFAKYLKLFKADKKTHELLTKALDTAKNEKAVSIETAISDYLKENYSAGEAQKIKDDSKLKNLGLKERSVADWKKLFKLKDTENGIIITQYIGKDPNVEVHEFIGKKPVIGIASGAFENCAVASIESPVSPSLGDFFACSTFPVLNVYGHAEQKQQRKKKAFAELKTAGVRQLVLFGSYGGGSEDGARRPIVWRVLKRDGNAVMLTTQNVVGVLPMHSQREKITWENCDLRRWLNELFYSFAFTDSERQLIQKTKLVNSGNPEFGTPSGNDTEDYVYILSIEEARSLYDTEADLIQGWYNSWYRTNGRYRTHFAAQFHNDGFSCDEEHGVRPVINLLLQD